MPTKKTDSKVEKKEIKEKTAKPKKTLAKADRPIVKEEKTPVVSAAKEAKQSAEYTLPTGKYTYANGKRKTSVARVRLYKGDGSIFINEKPITSDFTFKTQAEVLKSALKLVGLTNNFTITAVVTGGGMNSQAEAVRHAISKALMAYNETLRPTLKHAGLLTRDPRVKERKKYGFRKARRGRQFSKR
jgi:small subunit ribosomal protein S9